MGLIRNSMRMGDWNMVSCWRMLFVCGAVSYAQCTAQVNRAISLVRRFPPSNSKFGTNGQLMRALLMLVTRMRAHDLATEQKTADFRTFENRGWISSEVPSTSCTLRDPTAPFPSCNLPIQDSIDTEEAIVHHGIRACSAHNCSGMHCELQDVCLTADKTVCL
jgi:hypothetical protein